MSMMQQMLLAAGKTYQLVVTCEGSPPPSENGVYTTAGFNAVNDGYLVQGAAFGSISPSIWNGLQVRCLREILLHDAESLPPGIEPKIGNVIQFFVVGDVAQNYFMSISFDGYTFATADVHDFYSAGGLTGWNWYTGDWVQHIQNTGTQAFAFA